MQSVDGLQKQSEAAQASYAQGDNVDLHNVLDLKLAPHEIVQPGASTVVPMDRILVRQKRRAFRSAVFAAAALFVVLGVALKFILLPEPEALLTFRSSADSGFKVSHAASDGKQPKAGSLAVGSRMLLEQGTALYLLLFHSHY